MFTFQLVVKSIPRPAKLLVPMVRTSLPALPGVVVRGVLLTLDLCSLVEYQRILIQDNGGKPH